ncbi:MAG: hypothetical protein ACI4RA_10880 [Kiritimatiellia bacterium]
MSFQYVPGLIRIPKHPNLDAPRGVWRGKGSDEGYFAFQTSGSWGGNLMVKDGEFCPNLLADGSRYRPVYTDINGYLYWRGSGYIYYSLNWGWIMCSVFPGYEPVETSEYDSEAGETVYGGDSFYTINSIPSSETSTVRMTPRGALRNKEVKTLSATWNRWVGDSEFGEYKAKGDASGTRILGLPKFRGNGETFIRSLNKERGYYTYGRIHNTGGKWVIGEIGSAAGWHEGSEPQPGSGATTFKFCVPEGSEAKGANITVSFDSYVMGEETDLGYLGEVAIWR